MLHVDTRFVKSRYPNKFSPKNHVLDDFACSFEESENIIPLTVF
jgi:hypothetical protein